MKYDIKKSAERIREERESMRCKITRDENDKEIVEITKDDDPESSEMSQEHLLKYMRQLKMDSIGRNKLSALENGDEDAFYSLSISKWKALADVFGVSIEYITGQEPYRSPTIKALCEMTGLSIPAAELLSKWKYEGLSALLECLSDFITHKDIKDCLESMMNLQELYLTKQEGNFEKLMDVHQRNQMYKDLQDIPYTTDAIVRDINREIKTEKYNINLILTNMIDDIAKAE